MTHARIRVWQLGFTWPDGTPVFDGLSFALGARRTGLVAPNGAGKSTLLRLLAGQLAPTCGHIETTGRVAWLPQQVTPVGDRRVADVLGIADTLHALSAIAAGDMQQALFDAVGEDWDLPERAHAMLAKFGLGHVTPDRAVATLSGGEAMALSLAAQWWKAPDILLLDEPSNHLDAGARQRLYRMIDEWDGALVVASHDRALLERMEQIAELEPSTLRLYGGGFGFYQDAARTLAQAAEQDVQHLRQQVKREQRERQQARERNERRAANASRRLPDAGLARIVAGNRARAAQVTAGRSDDVHAARIDDASQRLAVARRALRDPPDFAIELPATGVPTGRLVFRGRGLQVLHDGREVFAPGGIDLEIRGPERIAIVGANGSGKTTLARLVSGDGVPHAGELKRGEGRVALLSQQRDGLDPNGTVSACLAAAAPGMGDGERANLLARWLFRGDAMHLPVAALSGGERLRASLACVLHADPAPQLLVLDEPTNDLDLASVRELERALAAYRGALVVISHDEAFVDALSVTRRLALVEGRCVEAA